jgi:hypothetical protein
MLRIGAIGSQARIREGFLACGLSLLRKHWSCFGLGFRHSGRGSGSESFPVIDGESVVSFIGEMEGVCKEFGRGRLRIGDRVDGLTGFTSQFEGMARSGAASGTIWHVRKLLMAEVAQKCELSSEITGGGKGSRGARGLKKLVSC